MSTQHELTSTLHYLLIITDSGDSYYTTFADGKRAHAEMVSFLQGVAAEQVDYTRPEPEHIEWSGDSPDSSNSGWIEAYDVSAEIRWVTHLA
jgi:hypothetical protein